MIVVINAGGSGTRLWPLSTPEYPKHLLSLVGEKSLLQETYARAKELAEHVYVATEAGHVEHVKAQLPELSDEAFIVEPARRGTAGCIIACLSYLGRKHDAKEPIAFLPADHIIHDTKEFVYSFETAAAASSQFGRVTLVGIEPTRPSTGFGYIHKQGCIDDCSHVYEVAGFKEKPELKKAQEYVASGEYLWNCGCFVGSVETFTVALKKFSPDWFTHYQTLFAAADEKAFKDAYLAINADAIDYALLELDSELLVVPATFDWVDVGSFTDVHQVVPIDNHGNHLKGSSIVVEDVKNTLVIDEENTKSIGLIGLDNVVVINTKNGILIARKDQDQKVKSIVNALSKS